jgi:hypothetical protein
MRWKIRVSVDERMVREGSVYTRWEIESTDWIFEAREGLIEVVDFALFGEAAEPIVMEVEGVNDSEGAEAGEELEVVELVLSRSNLEVLSIRVDLQVQIQVQGNPDPRQRRIGRIDGTGETEIV